MGLLPGQSKMDLGQVYLVWLRRATRMPLFALFEPPAVPE